MNKKIFAASFLLLLAITSCGPKGSNESIFHSEIPSREEISESISEFSSEASEIVIKKKDLNLSEFSTASGSFEKCDNSIISKDSNSIAYINESFEEGTFSFDMVCNNKSEDNGVIFGLKNEKNNFWESSCSYYFFFISKANYAYLGKVDKGWTSLSETPLSNEQISNEYSLKIVRYHLQNYDVIDYYVDDVYMGKYRDYSPLIGNKVGIRTGQSEVIYKNGFISNEIINKEKEIMDYDIVNGNFDLIDNKLVSKSINSLAVISGKEMEYGSFSVDMVISEAGDNGICFGIDDGGYPNFWERNVSYYFFFISKGTTAYLGKVVNGTWKECSVVGMTKLEYDKKYSIEISRDEISICCYIDGKLMINYSDDTPIVGNKVGVRAGSIGTAFDNFDVQKSSSYEFKAPENFSYPSGEMVQINSLIKSNSEKAMIVSDEEKFEGSFSVKMCPGSNTNNGIIFCLTKPASKKYYEKVAGLSYYFFHITSNNSARLIKFDGLSATVISEIGLSAGYSAGVESLLTVIVNGNNIKCYVDDACFVNFTDENMLEGGHYGLKATSKGVLFSDFLVSDDKNAKTADIVLFGHSHVENYFQCHEALESVGSVANMGVGGSIIRNWVDRVNQIFSYNPKYIVIWLGSNDLGASIPVNDVISQLKDLITNIHNVSPKSQILVMTEFYQPENFRNTDAFHENTDRLNDAILNRLQYYVKPVDVFDVPLKNGELDLTMFKDVYHLTFEAYSGVTDRLLKALTK